MDRKDFKPIDRTYFVATVDDVFIVEHPTGWDFSEDINNAWEFETESDLHAELGPEIDVYEVYRITIVTGIKKVH